jgi:hypothetical protein
MNIYLEIFGYIGTGLVITSMMMRSINKLRILNISGAVISMIYAILVNTWPVVVLNACLTLINLYHLISAHITARRSDITGNN